MLYVCGQIALHLGIAGISPAGNPTSSPPNTKNLKTTVELEYTTLVLHSKLGKVGAWIPVAHRRISCHAHRGMIACPVLTIERTRTEHPQRHAASAFRRKRYDALRKTAGKRGLFQH
jgi:hypothetical protein